MTAPETFSLQEYADALLGGHGDAEIHWLTRRLRGEAKPVLPGYKAGRRWRATRADIEQAIELLRRPQRAVPELPNVSSMTKTSKHRLGVPG